ncbi:tetratricopeptide repeat protein [Amycolatopsis taiwanensis]|uniref:tetratricopeptide repeat protein n=1 Tax=Amycolatopsis taiwanensis TaxID=342230 RepID=UPI0025562A59|nr:tetratricopeptide repeat protein [Amycolatopsis taiwanensis]
MTTEGTGDITPLTFRGSGYDGARAWCEAEAETAIHIARHAHSHGVPDAAWMLPTLFLPYFHITKNWRIWLSAASAGLTHARRIRSTEGEAWCLHSLGWAQHELGHIDDAIINLGQALRLRDNLGDDRARGLTLFSLGAARLSRGDSDGARRCIDQADAIFTGLGFTFGLAFTRSALAHFHQAEGDPAAARRAASDALDFARPIPSPPLLSRTHHQYGLMLLSQHQPRAALDHLDTALTLRRGSRERWGEAETLIARAETLTALGQPTAARVNYREAANILAELDDPRVTDVQARIAALSTQPQHDPL